jgi:hypothetical protein
VAFRAIQDSDAPPRSVSVSGESMDDAFASFMDALSSLAPPDMASHAHVRHLAGELSRISLLSLLTLCQMERVTGLILLTNGTSRTRAYLHEGELVDAAIDGRDVSPRSALQEVVGWREGHFEVVEDAVRRENRFGVSTTILLIDLAREFDEAGRAHD